MRYTNLILLCSGFMLLSCEVDQPIDSDSTNLKGWTQNNVNNKEKKGKESNDVGCETLFAFGSDNSSTCFMNNGFIRWGWTIGPLDGGFYTFELFSGAGQCETIKGTSVGILAIDFDAAQGIAQVIYAMADGFVLNETHLYVGSNPYPLDRKGNPTVSPGQFPNKNDELNEASVDFYTVTDLSGPVYVIAHGVVCETTDDGNDGGNIADFDGDGIPDTEDNCPMTFNPDQADANNNGRGDVCDVIVPT